MYCLTSNTATLVEHLKAQRLVKKLEGGRSKGRQVVLTNLVPYPALVSPLADGEFCVRFPDLEGIEARGADAEVAMQAAQNDLLRHLITALREDKPVPRPHAYLELVDESSLVMIDPLGQQQSFATIL